MNNSCSRTEIKCLYLVSKKPIGIDVLDILSGAVVVMDKSTANYFVDGVSLN